MTTLQTDQRRIEALTALRQRLGLHHLSDAETIRLAKEQLSSTKELEAHLSAAESDPAAPVKLILHTPQSADRPFTEASPPAGMPSQKDGHPIAYRWKESLPLGSYLDAKGERFNVDSGRIANLINNFNRAKANGFLPHIPPNHETTRGDANFGFIVGARTNDRGSLELLHQLIGEDAIKAAARNSTSIATIRNAADEHGNVYDELINHNALTPSPQLTGLRDFEPALAASRGGMPAVVLELSSGGAPGSDADNDRLGREGRAQGRAYAERENRNRQPAA